MLKFFHIKSQHILSQREERLRAGKGKNPYSKFIRIYLKESLHREKKDKEKLFLFFMLNGRLHREKKD